MSDQQSLNEVKEQFIAHWGSIGTNWGINRTFAQIHALLLVSSDPCSTDEIMESLGISRGNANMNLRELASWGLIRGVVKKGERREFFEAEKDIWEMAMIIARERRRREIEPTRAVLSECSESSSEFKTEEGIAFHKQMEELLEFVEFSSKIFDKVVSTGHSGTLKIAAKLLK